MNYSWTDKSPVDYTNYGDSENSNYIYELLTCVTCVFHSIQKTVGKSEESDHCAMLLYLNYFDIT